MLTDLKVLSLACKCVFYRPEHDGKGRSHDLNFDFLKSKNEIYRWIELKEYMRKIVSFIWLYLLPDLWSLKCQK